MSFLPRLGLAFFVVAVLIAVVLPSSWAALLGVDRENVSELLKVFMEEQQRNAEIANRNEIVRERIFAQYEITNNVIAGRLTLFEAAAAFRDVRERTKVYVNRAVTNFPGDTLEERQCRQVISWVRSELSTVSPDEGELLVEQLEAELQEHKRQHGTVRLPKE